MIPNKAYEGSVWLRIRRSAVRICPGVPGVPLENQHIPCFGLLYYFIVISAGLYFFWHIFVTRELVYSLHSSNIFCPFMSRCKQSTSGRTNGVLDAQMACWTDSVYVWIEISKTLRLLTPSLHPEVYGVFLRHISIIFSIAFSLGRLTLPNRITILILSLGNQGHEVPKM